MFKLKSFIQAIYYQYILTDKQRQQYYLNKVALPRVNLRIRAVCGCSNEDAQLLIKEAQRISNYTGMDINNMFDIIEYNLIKGVPYNVLLTMFKHWG